VNTCCTVNKKKYHIVSNATDDQVKTSDDRRMTSLTGRESYIDELVTKRKLLSSSLETFLSSRDLVNDVIQVRDHHPLDDDGDDDATIVKQPVAAMATVAKGSVVTQLLRSERLGTSSRPPPTLFRPPFSKRVLVPHDS